LAVAPRLSILITHPGRQHSHQAAAGLARAGLLAGYWAGVPALAEQVRWLPQRLWARYQPLALPAVLVRCAPWTPGMRRLGDRLPRRLAQRVDLLACRLFDRWAAVGLRRSGATAVIACEISALETFRRARRLGMATILDAPSIHHREQDRVQPTLDSPALHRRIAAVKEAEIALADHVLTVSELARATYVQHGSPPHRVHALTLGADPGVFAASPSARRPARPPVFLFAGAAIRRKGVDVLIDAFERVRLAHPETRLRVVGPRGDASDVLAHRSGVEIVGALDQAGLAAELQSASCLVLPSRHDSFGMVVVESLAAGTPVIVSEMVGAKDLVVPDRSGWIVPVDNVAALAERMRWCAEHPDDLLAMLPACRAAAAAATWDAYHRRLAELLTRALAPPDAMSGAASATAVPA
jgi:glycosyltransferase involved in cell wall biosynthesis